MLWRYLGDSKNGAPMLTDLQVRQAKGEGLRAKRFWDERGLYLEVTPPSAGNEQS